MDDRESVRIPDQAPVGYELGICNCTESVHSTYAIDNDLLLLDIKSVSVSHQCLAASQ